jgi:hypothetical protein
MDNGPRSQQYVPDLRIGIIPAGKDSLLCVGLTIKSNQEPFFCEILLQNCLKPRFVVRKTDTVSEQI